MTLRPFYVMDVCSTCGRPAAWPYCEHRQTGYPMDETARTWTEAIVVEPATPRGRELATRWVALVSHSIDETIAAEENES